MTGSMFDGLSELMLVFCILALVLTPLGLWKLAEIIIWLANHIRIGGA